MGIFTLKLTVCFILSLCVGLERQYHNKITGLRTNVLVGIGSFLFAYLSLSDELQGDQFRVASQIVCGIGFLGAGVILRDRKNKITGLNTAATLWCVAAIGVLTASDMLFEAFIGTMFVLFSNIFLRLLSNTFRDKYTKEHKERCVINLSCDKEVEILVRNKITEFTETHDLKLDTFSRTKHKDETIKLKYIIVTVRDELVGTLVRQLELEVGITKISWSHKKLSELVDIEDDETLELD